MVGCTITGSGCQQPQIEDRATMGVDPTRRRHHPPLGVDAEFLKGREIAHPATSRRNLREIASERKQAAHEGRHRHVVMRAVVDRADETGLGVECEFGVERTDRQPADGSADVMTDSLRLYDGG